MAPDARAQQTLDSRPLLKMDVAAAMQATTAEIPLGPMIVRGKRHAIDALPCIGCDGRQIVPMRRLKDLGESLAGLLVAHPPSRPDSPEDRAMALAYEGSCLDGASAA